MQTDEQFLRAAKPAQEPKKASEKALDYMRDMYRGRDWERQVEVLPPEWQEMFHTMATVTDRQYAHADCSKFIDLLKTCDRKGPTSKTMPGSAFAANPPIEDGIYHKKQTGKFFKVYWNLDKDRLLAKEIVLLRDATEACTDCHITKPEAEANPDDERLQFGECNFVKVPAMSELQYRGQAYRFVTADDKYNPTLEEAIAFGPKYGRCSQCGRNLNDELSVQLGIGPVCGARDFGDAFKVMKKMAQAELDKQEEYVDLA